MSGSDGMTNYGLKYDGDKVRLELVPMEFLNAAGRALTFGASKYSEHNWANGIKISRLVGALLRHTSAWWAGEHEDPESGLNHLDHACACLAMLIATVERIQRGDLSNEFWDHPMAETDDEVA